jgi:hypothetical protein
MADNKNNNNDKFGKMKCIWMDAGVVNYKMCSQRFDCENCLFDKVLRNADFDNIRFHYENTPVKDVDIIEQKLELIKETGVNRGYTYLKNNMMVKKLLGKTYYLGLTPLAYTLLENIAGFNYCRDNMVINSGDPLVQFIGDWGSIKILSPLNFYCLCRLKQELNDFTSHEWFSLVELEHDELVKSQISEDQYLQNCNEIGLMLGSYKNSIPNIGITLNDGGEKLRYVYQITGSNNYHSLIEKLFS